MNFGFSRKLPLMVFGLVGLMTIPRPSTAAIVNSIFDAQPTFEVVTETDKSGDLSPGIYGLSKTASEPSPLVNGEVLGVSRAFNGVLAQLSMGHQTSRQESIAVVNGSIVVFSNASKADDSTSRVTIGGAQGLLPIDPLTKVPFAIGSVDNIADINIAQRAMGARQSVVLVSLRRPSPMGQGVTFGFVVDAPPMRSKASGLKLSQPPILLNFEFFSAEQLSFLFVDRSDHASSATGGVYSHILLNSFVHPKSDDSVAKAKWRETIGKHSMVLPSNLPGRRRTGSTGLRVPYASLPWLNLATAQTVIPRFPVRTLHTGSVISVIQREDPARDLDRVYLIRSKAQLDLPTLEADFGATQPAADGILGRVDLVGSNQRPLPLIFQAYHGEWFDAPEKNLQKFKPTPDISVNSLMTKINGQFHLSFILENNVSSLATFNIEKLLKLNFENVTKLNYVHYVFPPKKGETSSRHRLLVSYSNGKGGSTRALTFTSDGVNFQPENTINLDNRFQTGEQIARRTLVFHEGVFYDPVSNDRDLVKSLQDEDRRASSHAHIDLESGKLIFLEPRKRIDLLDGLSWLGFENLNRDTNVSGYYRFLPNAEDPRSSPSLVAYGDIKARPKDFQTKDELPILRPLASLPVLKYTADELELEDNPNILGEYNVLVYASEIKDTARTDFTIALDQGRIPVSTTTFKVPLAFSQLSDIHIIRHRRSSKNSFSVLFFFNAKGKDKDSGGVFAGNFTVKKPGGEDADKKPFVIETGPHDWITRSEVDPGLIRSRVVFDALGAPVWIDTPHLEKSEEDFTVVRIAQGAQGRAGLAQLTSNVNFNETLADSELQKSTISDWNIYFAEQIAKKRTDLKLHSDNKKETKKDRADRDKKTAETEATFPTLNAYLDQLAVDSLRPQHTILLVEKEMKTQFLEGMFDRFGRNRGGEFSVTNNNFHLYMFQPESTPVKYRQELSNIARKGGKKLLFVDGRDLINSAPMEDGDEEGEAEAENRQKEEPSEEKEEVEQKSSRKTSLDLDETVPGQQPPERFTAPLVRTLSAEGAEKHLTSVEQVAQLPKRVPMVIVMTPFEWRRLQEENPEDNKAYLHQRFKVDASFLTSGWAIWPPRSTRAKPEIKEVARAGVSQDAVRVFDQLNNILLDAANPKKPRKHQILIYPDELAPLMEKLIVGRWASETAFMNTPWNHRNPDLALLRLPKTKDGAKITQQNVFENYGGLREIRKSKTPVVLAQLNEVNQVGRPESEAGAPPFLLRDPSAGGTAGDLKVSTVDEDEAESEGKTRSAPHILWLMATEGARLQPGIGKEWSLRSVAPVETSTIIYGTEGEFSRLKSELNFESRFGNLLDSFEIVHLQEPPVDLRRQLVREIFQRHQVRSLDLNFKVGDGPAKSDPTDLVSVLISRVEQQAYVANQDPTTAFIRVYSLIQAFVSEDKTIRENRLVDKAAVERLLSRVFPTGLKPESQPPNHPINIVKDTTKAALLWQKAGYRGYADLKRQILELYYSQTESVQDQGRPVRFATIFFGPTSTGKSYLLQTLFDFLNLKPLDALNPNFRESDYYFIKVHELTEEESNGPMSVEKALLRAEQLLCHNPQAHIVFDDLHKAASDKMLKRIISWMSAIFDANKGMISFRCGENERREVPVMNMGLHITVNPTTDQKMRDRVRGRDYLETEILAGLSKGDFILEGSFLARIPAKFNMERFPAGAKFATLINDSRKASQAEFISKEALVLVAPLAIQRLVDRFGEANAREFSSNATVSLMQISHDLPKSPVYIVDLKNTWKRKLLDRSVNGFDPGGITQANSSSPFGHRESEVTRDSIKAAIQDIITYRAVDGENAGSMLDFVSFIVDGFRIHAYQIMLDGLMEDEQLNSSLRSRQHFIGEMLLATYDSLVEWGTIPLNNLSLQPRALGWPNEGKIPEFIEELKSRSESESSDKRFFRFRFSARAKNLEEFNGDSPEELDRRVTDVLSETSHELRLVLMDVMKAYFRVKSLRDLPTPGEWFDSLPDLEKKGSVASAGQSELRDTLYQAGQRIAAIYGDFTERLFDNDLLERKIAADRLRNPLAPIASYDQARMFLQALDKAVVSLPWDRMTHFAWTNMKEASRDMNLAHLPRFQHLLFKSEFSPYATVTPDSIFQSVTGNPLYKNLTDHDRNSRRDRFDRDCQSLLLTDSNIIPARVEQ